MSKKRLRTLAIVFVICMIIFYSLIVRQQHIEGIAVNSQGKLAVAVRSAFASEISYLYIYSEDDRLQEIVLLPSCRGGIDGIRAENDFIYIYSKAVEDGRYTGDAIIWKFDFNGTFLIKEIVDTEIPKSLFECKSNDVEYVYSINRMGFEKVTKYTADGKSKAVFKGWRLYIGKMLWNFIFTSIVPVPMVYGLIYRDAKSDYSREDLQEIDAKLHKWWKERKNRKK